jgi:hypothetical protein
MSLRSAVPKLDQPVLVSADDSTGDLSLALGFDDLGDLFLERSDLDELVNLNVRFLDDSEGTVGCLVLDGGVPPPVEMEDMVGCSQVQPCPTGLEREDEATRVIAARRLKAIHHAAAMGFKNLSAQPYYITAERFFKMVVEENTHFVELGENQGPVAG